MAKQNIIVSFWKYWEPIWTGRDGRPSIRAMLAIFFSWKLIENLDYAVRKWEAGRDLGALGTLILALAGLIAALLGISAYQNVQTDRITADMQAPAPINVEKANTVNTDNIETVNTGTINTQPSKMGAE